MSKTHMEHDNNKLARALEIEKANSKRFATDAVRLYNENKVLKTALYVANGDIARLKDSLVLLLDRIVLLLDR